MFSPTCTHHADEERGWQQERKMQPPVVIAMRLHLSVTSKRKPVDMPRGRVAAGRVASRIALWQFRPSRAATPRIEAVP